MLAPQLTIMRRSTNFRCEGATAKLDFLWILNVQPPMAEAILFRVAVRFLCSPVFSPTPYVRQRIWEQTRTYLLPDAFVSAPRYNCISPQIRLRLLPRSLVGIGRVFGKKSWRCVPMRSWPFKIRLSPSASGHSAVCLLSCAVKICRAETNIKKSRDIPPNSQKLLLLLPVSIYLRKKT